jgi:hypothetical protein
MNTTAPVFIKRSDGVSFKSMKSSEVADILRELEQKFGSFEKGKVTIAAGGDLLIRPANSKQQENLLDTSRVLKDIIEVITSLPNSVTKQRIITRLCEQAPQAKTFFKPSTGKAPGDQRLQIQHQQRYRTTSFDNCIVSRPISPRDPSQWSSIPHRSTKK